MTEQVRAGAKTFGEGPKYRLKSNITEYVEAEIFQRDKGVEDAISIDGYGEIRAYIKTPKGAVFMHENDVVITYPDGERIVCNPSIFEKIYERVKE